ncbi:MAG TPA: hypothetical protein VN914_03440, partial [Polyangia bacterium]|nr:hypothetical protein [Polyangia bacterium]
QLGAAPQKAASDKPLSPSLGSEAHEHLHARTGEDPSHGKERRPATPPAPAATALPAAATGQILPGAMTRRPTEIVAETAPASVPTVARPLQSPSAMSNAAAHTSLEAPRLVAAKRSPAAEVRAEAGLSVRLDVAAPRFEVPAHAKVLTDGASRKSDGPADATNVTKAVMASPVSTVRVATLSPVAHTANDVVAAAKSDSPKGEVLKSDSLKSDPRKSSLKGDSPKSATPSPPPPPANGRGRSPEARGAEVKHEGSDPQGAAPPTAKRGEVGRGVVAQLDRSIPTTTQNTLTPTTVASERPRPVFTARDARVAPAAEAEVVRPLAKLEARAEVKAETAVLATSKPVAVQATVKVETAVKVQTSGTPAATPARAAKHAFKAEPVSSNEPARAKTQPVAVETAPVAVKTAPAPVAPIATPVKAAAPAAPAVAQPAAEERPVASDKPAPSGPEARPAAKKSAAPARAHADEPAPTQPVTVPVQPAPAAPAARPAALETAAPVVAEVARAAAKPVVAARAHAAEPELAPAERRKRPQKDDKIHEEREETARPAVTAAPLVAHAPFERVVHRAAADGHARVESLGRREPEAKETKEVRAGEPAAAPSPLTTAPAPQHQPAAEPILPFTPVQQDAAAVAFAPAAAAPIVAQAAEDAGLSVSVLPQAARVSVESPEGDLALHLRIKDGNAEVSIGGSLAPMFEQRSAEVQTVLAGEGLSLGRFDLKDNNQHGHQAPRELPGDDAAPARPTTNPARPSEAGEAPVRAVDGRIHVTA